MHFGQLISFCNNNSWILIAVLLHYFLHIVSATSEEFTWSWYELFRALVTDDRILFDIKFVATKILLSALESDDNK